MAPKINRDDLVEVRIKAGQNFDFDVRVEGEPPPKIEWQLNSEPLASTERTKIDNSQEYKTKLKTMLAKREDSGTYKIIATNANGKDEATVNVIVMDVPGIPGGKTFTFQNAL